MIGINQENKKAFPNEANLYNVLKFKFLWRKSRKNSMNLFSKNNSIFHQMIYTTEMISKHLKINSILRNYLKGRKCLRRNFLSNI